MSSQNSNKAVVAESETNKSENSSNPTTQVENPAAHRQQPSASSNTAPKRPSSFDYYFSASVIIMAFAALFFGLIAAKYFSLRPRIEIERRLKVCGQDIESSDSDCISAPFALKCIHFFASLVPLLDDQSARMKCTLAANETMQGLGVEEILEHFRNQPQWSDEPMLADILSHLIGIIDTTPQFGLSIEKMDSEKVGLIHDNPSLSWSCWTRLRLQALAAWTIISLKVLGVVAVAGLINYLVFRIYKWRAESLLQEQQEVFEMVEQVLSLLMKHHHHLTLQDSSRTRASLPVNHIRYCI